MAQLSGECISWKDAIQSGYQQTILIVDDQPTNINLLAEALKDDYQIKLATRGAKALELALSDQRPDLILLDINMPEMDGYEVCRQLKANDISRQIPVIFITAEDSRESEAKGLGLGAIDYIVKPFYLPIVKARVRTHIDLKRKNDMLEHLAAIDSLTDLPNRRCFESTIEREWRRHQRSQEHLSLLMIDIDNFKTFNDTYGHQVGDNCLRQVATALGQNIKRPADLVARYGGEEFVVVLPQTELEGAIQMGEEFRLAVDALNKQQWLKDKQSLSISVGVATMMPEGEQPAEALIEAADQHLYLAKTQGKNRVVGNQLV